MNVLFDTLEINYLNPRQYNYRGMIKKKEIKTNKKNPIILSIGTFIMIHWILTTRPPRAAGVKRKSKGGEYSFLHKNGLFCCAVVSKKWIQIPGEQKKIINSGVKIPATEIDLLSHADIEFWFFSCLDSVVYIEALSFSEHRSSRSLHG